MAAKSTLKVIFTGEDKLSGVTKKITGALGGLKERAIKLTKRLAALGAAGTAALVGISIKAIQLAADADEMKAKFDVVFGNLGGRVLKEIQAFSDATGLSRYELQGMTADIGDLLVPLGFTREEAAGFSVDLVKLAADISAFNNMPMTDALNRLRGTLVGSHTNALAFGVVINENVLKQELLRMGMADLEGQELELAKVQARLNLLFRGTADAQGIAAAEADGFSGKIKALQGAFRDWMTELGERLMPVAEPFLDWAQQVIREYGPQLIEFVGEWADKIADFLQRADWTAWLEGIKRLLSGDFIGAWESFVEGVSELMRELGVSDAKVQAWQSMNTNLYEMGQALAEGDWIGAWQEFVQAVSDFMFLMGASEDRIEAWQNFNLHLFNIKTMVEDGDWIGAFKEIGPAIEDLGRAIGISEENLGKFKLALATIGILIAAPRLAGGLSLITGIASLAGKIAGLAASFSVLAVPLGAAVGLLAAMNTEAEILGTTLEERFKWLSNISEGIFGEAFPGAPGGQWSPEAIMSREAPGSVWDFNMGGIPAPVIEQQNQVLQAILDFLSGNAGVQAGRDLLDTTGNTYNIYTSQVTVPDNVEAEEAFLGGVGP